MRTVLTPCIKVCKLDPVTSVCIGCNRTLEQIQKWRIYTDDQKIKIMEELKDKKYGLGCTN